MNSKKQKPVIIEKGCEKVKIICNNNNNNKLHVTKTYVTIKQPNLSSHKTDL